MYIYFCFPFIYSSLVGDWVFFWGDSTLLAVDATVYDIYGTLAKEGEASRVFTFYYNSYWIPMSFEDTYL
jgi:hypothetical protein